MNDEYLKGIMKHKTPDWLLERAGLKEERTPMSDPTFEEGPFFLVKELDLLQRQPGHVTQGLIVWASDGRTARQLTERKLGHRFVYDELIGDLTAVKDEFRLSPTQIADLHREGYLKL